MHLSLFLGLGCFDFADLWIFIVGLVSTGLTNRGRTRNRFRLVKLAKALRGYVRPSPPTKRGEWENMGLKQKSVNDP